MTGIIYGSSTGNTENVAKMIADKLGDSELINVSELSADIIQKFDTVLLGSSTWGCGDLQDDWDSGIDTLKEADLSGKKVGFFGCGDSQMYADTFVDAIGLLYEAIDDSAAKVVGKTSTEGYEFDSSKAVVDGDFIGLVIDEDNQSEMTVERVDAWVESIK
ncbi:MAG: flavodoxin [Spirochaetales bacterium]|nr:flavodoxin [Spirochaetales bacterium]